MGIAINNHKFLLEPAKKLPKGLIYRPKNTNEYRLFDTTNGNFIGSIYFINKCCNDTNCYKTDNNETTLHIYSIAVKERERNKGWGKYLIDFAKQESFARGCKGRCSLTAYHPQIAPHLFYKKMGFTTNDDKLNKFLDECINTKQLLLSLPPTEMFIPIKNNNTNKKNLNNNQIICEKIKQKFNSIKTYLKKLITNN